MGDSQNYEVWNLDDVPWSESIGYSQLSPQDKIDASPGNPRALEILKRHGVDTPMHGAWSPIIYRASAALLQLEIHVSQKRRV